jgi:predicted nucleotidyltransferase component of viral defense system
MKIIDKPIEFKIRKESQRKNVRWDVIERDYALSYVLLGISKEPTLSKSLVFKGGTALKKCYFGDYRFSEDLDFSSMGAPTGMPLEMALENAILISEQHLKAQGQFEIKLKRKYNQRPHPRGQEAFDVRIKFPGHSQDLCGIKLEITHDEPVILPPESRPVIHEYDEVFATSIACYHIEEIIAEKLRAILQTHEKLTHSETGRTRPRDYYDLWFLLRTYGESLDKIRLKEVLHKKCKHRGVSYSSIDDFYTELLVDRTSKSWKASLHLQIHDLPECQHVLDETKPLIHNLLWVD